MQKFEVGKRYKANLNNETRELDVLEYDAEHNEYKIVWDDGDEEWAYPSDMEDWIVDETDRSRVRISTLVPTSRESRKTLIKLQRSLDNMDPVWDMLDDIIHKLWMYDRKQLHIGTSTIYGNNRGY